MLINYLSWLVFGALVGWIMSQVMPLLGESNPMTDILIGSAASFLTGFVTQLFIPPGAISGFNVALLIISILGGIVCLATRRTLVRT